MKKIKNQNIDKKIITDIFKGMILADTEANMIKGGKKIFSGKPTTTTTNTSSSMGSTSGTTSTCCDNLCLAESCTYCFAPQCQSNSTLKGLWDSNN